MSSGLSATKLQNALQEAHDDNLCTRFYRLQPFRLFFTFPAVARRPVAYFLMCVLVSLLAPFLEHYIAATPLTAERAC